MTAEAWHGTSLGRTARAAQARHAMPPTMREDLTEALDSGRRKRPGQEFAQEAAAVLGQAAVP